jgi:hypothetical protein
MMKVPNDYYDKWNICDTDKILIYGCNKHIGSVMVNVLEPRAVDGGFGPRSDQTKHYEIDMCYSTKYADLKRKWGLVGSESE